MALTGSWTSDKLTTEGKSRKNNQRGVYWRARADGTFAWGYKAPGMQNIVSGCQSRDEAVVKYLDAAKRHKGNLAPVPTGVVKLSSVAESVKESRRLSMRPRAFKDWEKALERVTKRFGHRNLASISVDEVLDFRRELEEGRSKATVIKYEQPLKAIFNRAVARKLIPESPYALLEKDEAITPTAKRKARRWTVKELQAVLDAATLLDKRPEARQKYSPLVTFLVFTGTRISEALALRWQDVDLLGGTVTITHSLDRTGVLGPTKTEAGARRIPLDATLQRVLLDAKAEVASESDDLFVFAAKNGGPLGYWNARDRGVLLAMEKAGITDARVHDLRHAYASLLSHAGMTLAQAMRLLGHKDIRQTAEYTGWFGEEEDIFEAARAATSVLTVSA